MFRFPRLCIALIALLLFAGPTGAAQVLAQGLAPIELPAILSLTGPVAYAGTQSQQTIKIVGDLVNKSGGIKGHPLHITYYDDQSNPQVAVQLINQQNAAHASAVVGPMFTAPCASAAPLVEKAGPVMYCLTPGYQPTRGGYVFSAVTATTDAVETDLRYAMTHHWTRFAVLTTTDATGQAAVQALQPHLALPEFKSMQLVALESMNATDISVGAQLQRIKAARPEILFITGSGPPYGTALRGLIDAGMENVPVVTSSANMTEASMEQYKDILPKTALFTASRGLAVASTPKGPILDFQRQYFSAFTDAKVKADGVNVNAWDPMWILISALRHIGPNATAAQIHEYIVNLHGWVGINGVYDFSRGDQRGMGSESVVVYRWDPANASFLPASGAGGRPLGNKSNRPATL